MIPKQYPGRVTRKTKALRLLWIIVSCLLFRPFPPRLFWPWRRLLLCAFGARVHREANVYSSAEIWAPWNLEMECGACLGPHTVCYNQALVRLGQCATVSQHCYLCTAGHDPLHPNTAEEGLVTAGIALEKGAWVGARAFIGMGAVIGEDAIVGANAGVYKDVAPRTIVGGNPAQLIRERR